jgi:hypothetical protein
MQPSMILNPIARAVWIIASAPRIPPHFTSLTLMPSTQPSSAGNRARPWSPRRSRSGSASARESSAAARASRPGSAVRKTRSRSVPARAGSQRSVRASTLRSRRRGSFRYRSRGSPRSSRSRHLFAELDLDDRMRADFAHLGERLVERCDADRERRHRRARRVDAEQSPQRTVEIFADAVVQRDVESARFGGRKPAQQAVERVWIVAGVKRCQTGGDAIDAFAVALRGRALAERVDAVPMQAYEDRARDHLRRTRDRERVLEGKCERLDVQPDGPHPAALR